MENLFPLFFIVIVLLSIIGKIKKRPRPPKATKATEPGWIQKLNAMLAEIQERLQQSPQGGASGPSAWERLLKGADLSGSQPDGQSETRDDVVVETVKPVLRPAGARPVAPERAPTTRRDKTAPIAAAPPTQVGPVAKGSIPTLPRSRADLRQAVIWSEILGPPVALKDKPL